RTGRETDSSAGRIQQEGARQVAGGVSRTVCQGKSRSGAVLGGERQADRMGGGAEKNPRMESAAREMVCGRQAERFVQLPGPAPGEKREQAGVDVGGRGRVDAATDLRRAVRAGLQICERAAKFGREGRGLC